MDFHLLATVIAAVALIVAALGTIFPILPGSILSIITLIAWAWALGSPAAWTAGIPMPRPRRSG